MMQASILLHMTSASAKTRDVRGEQHAALREDSNEFLASLTRQAGSRNLDDGRIVPMLPFRLF
jgi:hypothetical protein